MKWLLLGALGGSIVTAGVIVQYRDGPPDSPKPVLDQEPPAAYAARAAPPVLMPSHEPVATSESRTASALTLARYSGQERARPIHHQPGLGRLTQTASTGDSKAEATNRRVANGSILAAEVSRIDAARSASTGGANDEAIRLIERYHQDFPKGALAPDADVVALEAVAAKGDKAEITRRAALFLSRYPADPHAARVKWLATH
jgi:TolA-binding protein